MKTAFVAVPDTGGRQSQRSQLWDDLLNATAQHVAISVSDIDAAESRRIINAMSHRTRRYMPERKLRTRWIRQKGELVLWIQ